MTTEDRKIETILKRLIINTERGIITQAEYKQRIQMLFEGKEITKQQYDDAMKEIK